MNLIVRTRQLAVVFVAAAALASAGGWMPREPQHAERWLTAVALPPLGDFGMPTRDALPPSLTVSRIQELLQGLGAYHGEVHGRLDDDTTEAIRAYQRRAGLEDNGRPTEELITHIEFTSKAIELGARLDAVKGKAEAVRIFTLVGRKEKADSPAFQAHKAKHGEVLAAYRAQQWDKAEALLAEVRKMDESDMGGFYDLIQERIDEFRKNPPGANWDGVFRATSK